MADKMGFSKNIDENVEMLEELLRGIPVGRRGAARAAAIRLENVIRSIQKDYANDPGAGVGLAFAIMLTAQRMVEVETKAEGNTLIQLLS